MSSRKDPQGAVPASSKGSWSSFLKSIASFNGDLSSLTAPPFILSSTSLVEYSAYWAEHPALFVAPAKEADPERRALLVLKWFLSTLHQQYCSRSEKLGSEKKPLNPFLGELFLGKWDDDAEVGETTLISEQVSHHPPVTAYAIRNEKHNVELQGYNAQKASFSSTIQVKQIGHALLSLTPPSAKGDESAPREKYLITLPSLHIEGLIYGTPFVELEKTTWIASTSGFVARIDYSGKGWLSGKKNSFTATLYRQTDSSASSTRSGKGGLDQPERQPLYTIDGQWSDGFVIRNAQTKAEIDRYTVRDHPTSPLKLAPVDQQDIYESRRAWRDVASAIERGDMDAVSVAKSKIENAQRELRKLEKAECREWQRRFFRRADVDAGADADEAAENAPESRDDYRNFMRLATILDFELESDKTGGVWRFDKTRAVDAKPPYYSVGGEGLGLD